MNFSETLEKEIESQDIINFDELSADRRNTSLLKNDSAEKEFELEMEIEQVYGIPYGEHAITINPALLDTKEYISKFDGLTPLPEINKLAYIYSKKAVLDNNGTRKESMYLIDIDTGDLIASIEKEEDKRELEIFYTDEFRKALDDAISKSVRILAIHNHPHGYPPSLDDISKIAENHYSIALVAGANGLVYRYYNPDLLIIDEEERSLYHDQITLNVRAGHDIDRAHKEVYDILGVAYELLEERK